MSWSSVCKQFPEYIFNEIYDVIIASFDGGDGIGDVPFVFQVMIENRHLIFWFPRFAPEAQPAFSNANVASLQTKAFADQLKESVETKRENDEDNTNNILHRKKNALSLPS